MAVTRPQNNLGYKPDLPDPRDKVQDLYLFTITSIGRANFCDLRSDNPVIYDQRDLGSCSANAVCGALLFAWESVADANSIGRFDPSRLYAYYNGRYLDDEEDGSLEQKSLNCDGGARLRNVLKGLKKWGVCPEYEWPYDTSKKQTYSLTQQNNKSVDMFYETAPARKIPKAAYYNALELKVDEYKRYLFNLRYYSITSPAAGKVTWSGPDAVRAPTMLDLLKRCLNYGYPFIFAFSMLKKGQSYGGASIISGEPGFDRTSGFLAPAPTVDKTTINREDLWNGAHAVLAVGYDDVKQAFLIRNSWGQDWGLGLGEWGNRLWQGKPLSGHFWMPYDWFWDDSVAKGLVRDFWVAMALDNTTAKFADDLNWALPSASNGTNSTQTASTPAVPVLSFQPPKSAIAGVGVQDYTQPASVVFMGKLWVFYTGSGNDGIWSITYNGSSWSSPRSLRANGSSGMSVAQYTSPSAVVFNGSLYLFFNGSGGNGTFCTISIDGSKWSPEYPVTDRIGETFQQYTSPSAVVFDERIFLFWRNPTRNTVIRYSTSFDGSLWYQGRDVWATGLFCKPSTSMAVTVFEEKLWLFFNGVGNDGIWMTAYNNGEWSAVSRVAGSERSLSNNSPGVFSTGNMLSVMWHRHEDQHIYFATKSTAGKWSDPGSLHSVTQNNWLANLTSPSGAFFSGAAYIFWVGLYKDIWWTKGSFAGIM